MKKEVLVRNRTKVELLARSITEATAGLDTIPGLLRQVIEEQMWREHLHQETGEVFKFDNFIEFVEADLPEGLGSSIAILIRLCVDDPLVVDLIDEIIQFSGDPTGIQAYAKKMESQGALKKHIATGTSRQAGLRQLRQHAESNPKIEELRQSVLAGELSVNKALIEAGLRLERLTIAKDPEKAAEVIKRSFNPDELKQLIRLLRQ